MAVIRVLWGQTEPALTMTLGVYIDGYLCDLQSTQLVAALPMLNGCDPLSIS